MILTASKKTQLPNSLKHPNSPKWKNPFLLYSAPNCENFKTKNLKTSKLKIQPKPILRVISIWNKINFPLRITNTNPILHTNATDETLLTETQVGKKSPNFSHPIVQKYHNLVTLDSDLVPRTIKPKGHFQNPILQVLDSKPIQTNVDAYRIHNYQIKPKHFTNATD